MLEEKTKELGYKVRAAPVPPRPLGSAGQRLSVCPLASPSGPQAPALQSGAGHPRPRSLVEAAAPQPRAGSFQGPQWAGLGRGLPASSHPPAGPP